MGENVKKERLIGLDILRILSMVLITLRHFIGYAGLTKSLSFFSVNGILVRILDVLCGSAVNIFVLISGYFLISSGFKWKRAFKIWGETLFYSVGCFLVAVVLGLETVTSGKMLLSFFPVLSRHYWFTVAYLALYVISPFLNKLIRALSEREYSVLILGGAVLLSLWTSVIYFSEGVLTGGNTGLLWFIYLYFLGGYIRFYPKRIPRTTLSWMGVAALTLLLLCYSFLSEKISFLQNFAALNDDSIFELLLSVLLFSAFLNVSVKSKLVSKLIVFVGGCSFGVYLIQESCMLRQWLWERLINPSQFAEKWYLIPVALAVTICLFILAMAGHKVFELLYNGAEKLFCKKKNL